MKTKIKYKIPLLVFLLLLATGPSGMIFAQTHISLLIGDNGSHITGSATSLHLNGNVYVYSVGSGNKGAVIEAPVGLGNTTRTFSVENSNAEADLTISGVISGTPGILKLENGNLKLGGQLIPGCDHGF